MVFLIALLGAGASAVRGEEGRPIIHSFEQSETGGEPYYWVTAQDERGVLYFGCDIVLSFDGEQWRQYPVPGSYAVRGLAVGRNGRLWVGAINEVGYFDREPTGGLSAYHSLVRELPPGTGNLGDVWYVFARGQGAVFVTSDSVLIWNGTSFRVDPLPGARRLSAFEVDGRIYVGHRQKGVFALEGDALKPWIPASAMNEATCGWMERTANGWLLGTTDGLSRYANGKMSPFSSPEACTYIRKHVIVAVARLADGDICVATADGGLLDLDPNGRIRRIVTQQDGLLTNNLCTLLVARDGALWVSSMAGVSRVVLDKGISIFGPPAGLAGKPCKSIVECNGQIFVETDDGVFSMPVGSGSLARFQTVPGFTRLLNSRLAVQGDSVYLAGFKGIERLEHGQSTHAFETNKDVLMLTPSREQPDSFLASVGFDLVRLKPNSTGKLEATELARLPDSAICAAEDVSGGVWAGTDSRGVFRIDHSQFRKVIPFRHPDGRPAKGRGLVARVGSHIAVCTNDGIVLCQDSISGAIPVAGAPHAAPLDISNPDANGRVWIAFPSPFSSGDRVASIGRLSIDDDGSGHWTEFAFPGLATVGTVHRLFIDQRGILWIGGGSGLLRVDTGRLEPIAAPHLPVIHATVALDGKLPWSHKSASLDFGAVEFGQPESVRFQTRLLPGTGTWSEPTANGHLTLAGLSDDAYDFEVRVINDAGLTGPPATWHFTVLPPWYRTKTAWAAWVFLVIGAGVGIIQWRSAWLRQNNRKLAELVRQRTTELVKANAAKSEFLANMSHEIRNPISGIVGLAIAMEETPLDLRQQKLMDSIRSCASLLSTLVDDVLDFAKIEAGTIDLRPAPFALRAILKQCTAMVAEEIRDRNGSISLLVAPELPARFVGDSARIQQIVLNYLTNALKFSPGRPIVLGAEPAASDRVRLYVQDRGPGISPADIAMLFTKFTRLERARTGNIRGTGLGLAVCRLLATKMGGTVGVDSKPGAGSCFWAELPLPMAPAVPIVGATPDIAPVAAAPLRALIVEDIDYNGIAMQAVLRQLGIESEIVTDGPGALTRLLNSSYDVVFMDWNLPGMIGTDVVARYRAIEPATRRRTIIIATTAYSEDLNREACLQAGMDAFISKPFTPEKIAAALGDLRESLRSAASVEVHSLGETSSIFGGIDLQFFHFAGVDAPDGLSGVIDRYLAAFRNDLADARRALADGSSIPEIITIGHRLGNHAKVVKADALIRLTTEFESNGALSLAGRQRVLADIEHEFAAIKDTLASIRAAARLG